MLPILIFYLCTLSYTYGENIFINENQDFCTINYEEKEESHYQLFSTSTAYDTVRSNIPLEPDCNPEALWGFIRHGTRYPHVEEMDRYRILESVRDTILSQHSHGKGKLTKFQLNLLHKWRLNVCNEKEMHITPSGIEELINLGKRLQISFPSILDKKMFHLIDIKSTNEDRTLQSATAVVQGMFGDSNLLNNYTFDESLLKNGKECPSWMSYTSTGSYLKNEIDAFKNTPEVQRLIYNVGERLGFGSNLTFDTIKDMYDVCGSETAWYHGKYSTWCAAFSTEELQLMEYFKDLIYYWDSGYGNPFTIKLGCELVRDMIAKLNSSKDSPRTNFYFAHSVGMRQLLVSLGIGKCCDPLLRNEYKSNQPSKEYIAAENNCWRTSHLSPFSANVISVLYRCGRNRNKFKVGVYINEKIVKFPFCKGKLCDFDIFEKSFSPLIDKSYCNRDFCTSTTADR